MSEYGCNFVSAVANIHVFFKINIKNNSKINFDKNIPGIFLLVALQLVPYFSIGKVASWKLEKRLKT